MFKIFNYICQSLNLWVQFKISFIIRQCAQTILFDRINRINTDPLCWYLDLIWHTFSEQFLAINTTHLLLCQVWKSRTIVILCNQCIVIRYEKSIYIVFTLWQLCNCSDCVGMWNFSRPGINHVIYVCKRLAERTETKYDRQQALLYNSIIVR